MLEEQLTYRVRGCVYDVFRELGAGFLEKVYEDALLIELKSQGFNCAAQKPLDVYYKGTVVGQFVVDIVVEEKVIIEIKAVKQVLPVHEAQLLNYLKATNSKVGLLVNFTHPKATIKRFVL